MQDADSRRSVYTTTSCTYSSWWTRTVHPSRQVPRPARPVTTTQSPDTDPDTGGSGGCAAGGSTLAQGWSMKLAPLTPLPDL